MKPDIARLMQVVELETRSRDDNIAAAFEGVVKARVEAELAKERYKPITENELNAEQYDAGYAAGIGHALSQIEAMLRGDELEYDLHKWWEQKHKREQADQQRKAERAERAGT